MVVWYSRPYPNYGHIKFSQIRWILKKLQLSNKTESLLRDEKVITRRWHYRDFCGTDIQRTKIASDWFRLNWNIYYEVKTLLQKFGIVGISVGWYPADAGSIGWIYNCRIEWQFVVRYCKCRGVCTYSNIMTIQLVQASGSVLRCYDI